jgi:hypothetical protein
MYYWKKREEEIWMLSIYSKSELETMPAHVLKQIAQAIEHG